ncbi:MAG: amino acid permease, partial [Planctomycetes bacterium]|nr:amino acid permease [Planctomycetota bacterium]
MSILQQSGRLRKELSLFSVFAIATGTTLSAGFFLLPGLAAGQAGPAVVLSYVIAAVLVVPAMLSIVELATAMPRSGGAYYFLDRSLGPLAGTVGGFGTWLALVLKSTFALIGMGAYIFLIFDLIGAHYPAAAELLHRFGPYPIAAGLAVFFGIVNLLGAKKTGGFQKVLVFGLLSILSVFIALGWKDLDPLHFQGFFDEGFDSIIATAGLVFISYVGVTNIASVSEEVKNPERNLPLGIFLAFITAIVVYGLGTYVLMGVVPQEKLHWLTPDGHTAYNLTPVATAAEMMYGNWGKILVTVAAILAFFSVGNAGIMSASRYPLAMSRDHILPPFFRRVSRRGIPIWGVLATLLLIVVI